MRRRHPNVPVRGPPDPVLVHYYGSNASIAPATYIVCLHGRVPEMYELWSLNDQGVPEVHPFNRIRLFDDFRADTFQTTFFNSRRFRIPFVGRISTNGSVKFIEFADVTLDTEVVISTSNIFVHEWGTNPTMLWPTVSNFTWRAYVPIKIQKGFCQWCNHERLRLKWVEGKIVALEDHLARVRQYIRDDVAANYDLPPVNNALGDAPPANSLSSSFSNDFDSSDDWVHIIGPNW